AALLQEDLGAAPDRVAVVDDEHLQSGSFGFGRVRHLTSLLNDPLGRRGAVAGARTVARSDLHHFEVFLASAALRARPVHRDVGPGRARCQTVLRVASRLVVDPTADQAHPGLGVAHVRAGAYTTMRG